MSEREILEIFSKSRKYTFQEISDMTGIDVKTVRTWRDLGIFNKEKTEVFRLKSHQDENGEQYAIGKDISEFFSKKDA